MILKALLLASGAWASSPFSDFRSQKPGVRHRITAEDLPPPGQTEDARNGPSLVPQPEGAWPQVPPGFEVQLYADGLDNPRQVRVAPNGDVFVAESDPGRITAFRGVDAEGRFQKTGVFARGLRQPFGIAFYPPGPEPRFVYVGNTDAVVRFPYKNGDLKASGPPRKILPLPSGGHWTRDLAFSPDGKRMLVSVGSRSNVGDDASERRRANILECDPEGKGLRVYAWGLRNPVGLAVHPKSGELWTSVNERDRLGDNLPPDYITHVEDGGFYGWPWYYIGDHQDPRHEGKRPELREKVLVPDVLIQPHNASLGIAFYDAGMFPARYRGDLFAAEHGSWNRSARTGYEVIRVLFKDGKATGEYEDFMTGFVREDGQVWGRPVAVAVASDGALIVSDDGGNRLWRVIYRQ
jgi:glucose/arabinose dehydrogenase